MNTVKKILDLLTSQERRQGYLLLVMIVFMALLDVTGVASIIPFMTVIANPDVLESNIWIKSAYTNLGFESTNHFLSLLGMVVLTFLVISISFKAYTTYTIVRFTHMRNYSISKRLVAGYLRQPYEWFLSRHSADLGKSILSEVEQVINGALFPLMQSVAHGIISIFLLILLLIVDVKLALISAAVLGGIYFLIYITLRPYLRRIGKERVRANQERYEVVQEAFGSIKDVKVASLEGAILNRYDGPARRFANHQAGSQVAGLLPRFAMEIIVFAGILSATLYLMSLPGGLQQSLPVLSVFAFAGYRLIPSLQHVYSHTSKLRFAGPALETLHSDFISLEANEDDVIKSERNSPLGVNKTICLKSVFYTYPDAEKPSLNDLNMVIQANTTIGLVGPTGSGKTTTIDIILGLLAPQNGQLTVDGEVITSDNVRAWQQTIGYVPQHIFLTDDTVRANIAFGVPLDQIDQDAVEHAARVANLHTFINEELPKGYDTQVGERGVRLSGGQRQRIGVARALYHNPQVLVLDEATSALDNLTEKAVMDALHNLGHSKTIIIIAHRLTTVQPCDEIFVLDKGCLLGQGTYPELVKSSPCFQSMVTNYES